MKKIFLILFIIPFVAGSQGFELPFGVNVKNPAPLDIKFFNQAGTPYTTTAQVLSQLTPGLRHQGLAVWVGNDRYVFKNGIADSDLVLDGGGDMVLAGTQTNTGLKTFLNGTLGMRNVGNNFTSTFTNTNTDARTYTLPDFTGNVFIGGGINNISSNTSLIIPPIFAPITIKIEPDDYTTTNTGASISNNYDATTLVGSVIIGARQFGEEVQLAISNNGSLECSAVFTDLRTDRKGIEYASSYAGILANDRSIPDIGTIKSGAFTSTGKKTFSVAGNIAGINVGANATDPTTALAAGDVYYQTGVGLRVYSGSAWTTLGAGGGSISNATDADFTAITNGGYNILDGVATANRVITIPTGANGDILKFFNTEDNFTWTFAGETVYLADRVTVVTQLLFNVPCLMERIDGLWIITN